MIGPDDPRHGSRNGYRAGCRDTCCDQANRQYHRDYYAASRPYLGYNALVNSKPTLDNLDWLLAHNTTVRSIATAVDVDESTIRYLLSHRPKTIQQATHNRLANLKPGDITTTLGLSRRIQALIAIGWPLSQLGRIAGIDKEPLRRLRDCEGDYQQAHVRQAVLDLYERLHMTPPTITDTSTKRAVTRALNLARRNGYIPPLGWDNIDDPHEVPDMPNRSQIVRVDLDEFEFLISSGEHPTRAAQRLGVSVAGVENAANRAGRQDLYDIARAARVAQRRSA